MNEPYAANVPPTTPLYVPPESGDTQAPVAVNQYGSPAMVPQGNVMPNAIIVNQQVPAVVVAPFSKPHQWPLLVIFVRDPLILLSLKNSIFALAFYVGAQVYFVML